MKQIFLASLFTVILFTLSVRPVMADGQYGQGGGSSTSEQPRQEVVHGTVNTGLGENLLILAAIIGGGALALILMAKLTRRVYLLD